MKNTLKALPLTILPINVAKALLLKKKKFFLNIDYGAILKINI